MSEDNRGGMGSVDSAPFTQTWGPDIRTADNAGPIADYARVIQLLNDTLLRAQRAEAQLAAMTAERENVRLMAQLEADSDIQFMQRQRIEKLEAQLAERAALAAQVAEMREMIQRLLNTAAIKAVEYLDGSKLKGKMAWFTDALMEEARGLLSAPPAAAEERVEAMEKICPDCEQLDLAIDELDALTGTGQEEHDD